MQAITPPPIWNPKTTLTLNQEGRIPSPLTRTELSEKLKRGEEVTCDQIVDALELEPVIALKRIKHAPLLQTWSKDQLLGYIIRNCYPALKKYLMGTNADAAEISENPIGEKAAEAIELLAPFVNILYLTEGYDDTLMDMAKKNGAVDLDVIMGPDMQDAARSSIGRTTERLRVRLKKQLTLRKDSILDNMPEGFLEKLLEKMDSITGVVVGWGVRVRNINEEIIKPLAGHPRLKTSLKTLDMRGLPGLTDDQIEIMTKSFENLTKWDLSNTDVSLEAISHIKNNMTKLSELSLRNCQHLTSEVYEILMEMESLTRIELSSANVGDRKGIPKQLQSKVVIFEDDCDMTKVTGRRALIHPSRMVRFTPHHRNEIHRDAIINESNSGGNRRGSVEIHSSEAGKRQLKNNLDMMEF